MFAELAVKSLCDFLQANYPAQLSAIEATAELEPGSIAPPLKYVPALLENDNRAPLVMIWDESFDPVSPQREALYAAGCRVALTQLGGTNLADNSVELRRRVSALIRTVRADSTLGGKVQAAVLREGSISFSFGDKSATRLAYVFPIEVRVHCP